MFLVFVFIGNLGETPDKRISEGLFCPFFLYWVFIAIIAGTPDKRISESLFLGVFYFYYLVVIGIIVGDPCKTYI